MEHHIITDTLKAQQDFFLEGNTRPLAVRLALLRKLRLAIHTMEAEILSALREDLGKSSPEAFISEIGMAYGEIRHMLRHLEAYAKPRYVRPSLAQLPGRGLTLPVPYGNVLIIAPWNYPFLLSIQPAIDAIAAGNTVLIKPSEQAPATTRVLCALVERYLPPEWFAVVPGDGEVSNALLDLPFHSIFFTGSPQTGRLVMKQAAKTLTPVTLELGGKSPCIVEKDANIPLAAKRIVFGKFLNCGQTCVAPDYVYVHEYVREPLLFALRKEIAKRYGEHPLENPQYGKIVNQRHFDRLCSLLEGETPLIGGAFDPDRRKIAPTVIAADPASPLMGEEIFGPILPVLTYSDLDEAVAEMRSRPAPLAFYLFTEDRELQNRLLENLPFGGGCINDTVLHLASPNMPFGGMGQSGLGSYHGKAGFLTFSHQKSILKQSSRFDLPLRYPPYGTWTDRFLRLLLR